MQALPVTRSGTGFNAVNSAGSGFAVRRAGEGDYRWRACQIDAEGVETHCCVGANAGQALLRTLVCVPEIDVCELDRVAGRIARAELAAKSGGWCVASA